MHDPIRQEGFLVFQDTDGPGMRFYKTREEAETVAKGMLRLNHPVIILSAVRFVTKEIQQSRGEATD
jgi:hypothetical protein